MRTYATIKPNQEVLNLWRSLHVVPVASLVDRASNTRCSPEIWRDGQVFLTRLCDWCNSRQDGLAIINVLGFRIVLNLRAYCANPSNLTTFQEFELQDQRTCVGFAGLGQPVPTSSSDSSVTWAGSGV
ncbi:hypothetical protein FS749_007955 [Ceratobasidium sp. UAMH 11750]|nr:hypothetical protein FS749_007955 [Ceratobasidium sp. UAMH 11750]